MVDWIPVLSQLKSAVQAIAGDTEGARKTQENFLDTCPVVSQAKSYVHWVEGDDEAARATQKKFLGNVSDIADGVPVVGHVKGAVHYACGDTEGGDNAMKSASRSIGVIGGGVVGGLTAGPVGAVAGGIAGGAAMDSITTGIDSAVHNEYRPAGQVAAVTNMVKGEASVGDVFDSAVGLTFDGISGYGAGKAAIKFRDTQKNVQVYRVAGKEEVQKSVKAQKFTKTRVTQGGEYWVSESTKHTTPYYETRTFEGKSAMKGKIPRKVYKQMKAEMIDQKGSKAIQKSLAKKGKGPANVFNNERLQSRPGKVNVGIKGDANLKAFNKHVHGIREIHPDSWKYKSSFNRGVCRYGKAATGTVLREHCQQDEDVISEDIDCGITYEEEDESDESDEEESESSDWSEDSEEQEEIQESTSDEEGNEDGSGR